MPKDKTVGAPSVPSQLRDLLPESIRYAMTPVQEAYAARAWLLDPSGVRIVIGKAEIADVPHRFFVTACKRIVDAHKLANAAATSRSRFRRREHGEVDCRDCADTGFVILTRDVGEEAQAGDAAPCHCVVGQQKQARYGTVHYGPEDFDPVVRDDNRISLAEYAASPAGKTDPHLPALLRMMKTPLPKIEQSEK